MNDLEYLKKYYKGNIKDAIERYNNHEPIQYIIGNVDFYNTIISVNRNVLIPRFETEELVDRLIKYIDKYNFSDLKILDLCTGSGCIAIALSKYYNIEVDASDISKEALEVAKKNNKINNTKVNFINSNLLDKINDKYNIIISNPPYISYDEKIEDIVKNNEPNIALYAKNNGLEIYELLSNNINKNLKEKFILCFEIGFKQGLYLKNLYSKVFPNAKVFIEKDLSCKDRYLFVINE